jgi:D-glucosaminate-6-phosphate ammonia-lyase
MKRRAVVKSLGFLPIAGITGSVLPTTAVIANDTPGPLVPGDRIYQSIGVEPVINCRGTITVIGGSTELPEVRQAMDAAAQHYVQLDELAAAAGKRFSELTGAEWGMVSSGCAAGLKCITAACVSEGNPEKLIRIPNLEGIEKCEVIIPTTSRNFYDHAIRNIGVKIINVDTAGQLQQSMSSRTALIYVMSNKYTEEGPLSLENIAGMAKPMNIPVVVDAAAEILSIPNIHLQRGATIVAYSGGKAIRGPQCAGLMLGDKRILTAAWQASAPHHGPCRDNKVGREEHVGMIAAVEAWVKTDHEKKEKTWLSWLDHIIRKVSSIESVTTSVRKPHGRDNRSASVTISWDPSKLNITGEEVAEEFAATKPRIALGGRTSDDKKETSISINAAMMQEGNQKIVADRVHEILTRKRQPKSFSMAVPSANLTGAWDVSVEYYLGKSLHHFFISKQEGNWVTGSHKGDFSLQEIQGTISGNEVKLFSRYVAPGDGINFTFAGHLEGDRIHGDLFLGEYLRAKFSATRSLYNDKHMPVDIPSHGRRSGNAW